MYSQNKEDEIIAGYFGGFKGTLLDIGANDGVTFSNSRLLIEKGWLGVMVEPSDYGYNKLLELYDYGCGSVMVCHCAIGKEDGYMTLYESGAHIPNGMDRALVSSLFEQSKERWKGVEFKEVVAKVDSWNTFKGGDYCQRGFEFITIDAEDCDWDILQQINLSDVGCRCLCIEWNSKTDLSELFKRYCIVKHGMRLLHTNAENMIFVK